MNYLALPIGFFLLYLIDREVSEKTKYLIWSRITCGIVCLIILLSVVKIQNYREENYNFWLGILPSFLAAIGLPFSMIVVGNNIKTIFINPFLSWSIVTFLVLTIYEMVLWIDGRNFDIYDILFTLIGSTMSGFIISNLLPKMIDVHFQKSSN